MSQQRMADAEEVVTRKDSNEHQSRNRNNNTFKMRAEIQDLKCKFQQQQATLQAITCSLEAASHGLLSHTSSAPYVLLAEEERGGRRKSFNKQYYNRGQNFRHRSGPPQFD